MQVQVKAESIELVDPFSLIPNPKNNNKHPKEQLERLAKIIQHQGFRRPVTVSNRSGFIVVGHARVEVAKSLGMKKVPVIFQDYESEADEYADLTADNALQEWSEIDLSQINLDIQDLGPFDIDLLGLKDFEVEPLDRLDPQTDEDAVPEVEHPITRRGDIWLLGNHRVMCGDSTMIDEVEKLMNGEKADMVFTDPPYGMKLDTDYTYADNKNFKGLSSKSIESKKYDKIKGDHSDFSEDFINNIFSCFSYCKEVFLWGADYYSELLDNKNEGSWVVWDKKVNESSDKGFGSNFELCWSKMKHKREIARVQWFGCFGVRDDLNNKRVHPSQKPVQLAEWFFKKWGKDYDCIDLFLGSGSTLIACEKTNRKCYGMELDEKYCDVIINRWQDFTGKTATLEATGQTYTELKVERDGENRA